MVARIASCAGYIAMTVSPLRLAPAALVLMLAGTALAQSAPMNLAVDTMQRVAVRGSISSVIVANPQIADATVVDANTLFVTGKGYGTTQVTAVDAIGRVLFQNQIVVTGGQSGSVRVWRGAQVTEMACASSCSPSIRSTGDAPPATPAP
jgi:Flp pilus assembly secretin CpaC